MGFCDNGFRPRSPAPIRSAPSKALVIDYFARSENVFGLKSGSWIGNIELVVDPEFVASTTSCARDLERVPAIVAPPHGQAFFQEQFDVLSRRRPNTKRGSFRS
jgi:hypothetical protein